MSTTIKKERSSNKFSIKTELIDLPNSNSIANSNSESEEDDNFNNNSEDKINNAENSSSMEDEKKVQIQVNNAPSENRCIHCKELFENPIMLLRHKREAHSFPKTVLPIEEIEKYYDYPNRSFCPICKRVIRTKNYRSIYLKHLHTHTGLLEFECVICKKKFKRKDHMLCHQKRHIVPIEDFM